MVPVDSTQQHHGNATGNDAQYRDEDYQPSYRILSRTIPGKQYSWDDSLPLQQSLDQGQNSDTIQWDTMRGVQSTLSNYIHSTPGGTGGAIMTNSKKTTFVRRSSTNTLWFKRFMDGSHERIGDVKLHNVALSIDILLELQQLLEASWEEAQQPEN
ncbi:hypothetical protein ACA910_003360 [Epithemia clementina (nom. ined.)]